MKDRTAKLAPSIFLKVGLEWSQIVARVVTHEKLHLQNLWNAVRAERCAARGLSRVSRRAPVRELGRTGVDHARATRRHAYREDGRRRGPARLRDVGQLRHPAAHGAARDR